MNPAQSVFGPCAAHCTPVALALAGAWMSRARREYANREPSRPGEGPHVQPPPTDTWEGRVTGGERFVGMLYAEAGGDLRWARAEKGREPSLSLTLWFSPCVKGRVRVALMSRAAMVDALVSDGDPVSRTSLLVARDAVTTGVAVDLFRVDGAPGATFGALFFSKEDVRFRRKGLWSIEPRLAGLLGVPLATILQRGRSGSLLQEREQW
jgi:hypothetical protein